MSFYYPQAAVKLRILPEDYQLTSDASLLAPVDIIVQSKHIEITSNDYKTSDTFNMKIDYKNFPFDPRTIRACGVVIYMQDMQQGGLKLVPQPDNTIFVGFVDEENISLDDTNQEVTLEGRDYTALLIDQKYLVNKPISEQKPLNVAISEFLSQIPALQNIKIINQTGDVLPSLGKFYPGHADGLSGQRNPGTNETYWSLIQDACARAGLVCFIRLDQLILTSPRNQATTVGDDIKFLYGKNVKKLTMKRKLGRLKNINISVRSRSGKNVIIAKIPAEAEPAWCASFGIKRQEVVVAQLMPTGVLNAQVSNTSNVKVNGATVTKSQKAVAGQAAPYLAFNIPNVASHAQLIKIGQTLYEQYSLQQLEGSLTTREMVGWSPPILALDPFQDSTSGIGLQSQQAKQWDLTQLQKGQSISIQIGTDDLEAISQFRDQATRENYLVQHGYKKEVATIFAKTMGKFSPRFQIKSYSMSLDADSGFELNINFQNILILTQAGL
jgi:hypothetical protein